MKYIFVILILSSILALQTTAQDTNSAQNVDPNDLFDAGITVLGRSPAPPVEPIANLFSDTMQYVSLHNDEQMLGIRTGELAQVEEYIPYPPSIEAFDASYPRNDGTFLVLRFESDDPALSSLIAEQRDNHLSRYTLQYEMSGYIRRDYTWWYDTIKTVKYNADTGFITPTPFILTDHHIHNTAYGDVWIFDPATKTFREPELVNGIVQALPNEGTWFLVEADTAPDHFYLTHNITGQQSPLFLLADPDSVIVEIRGEEVIFEIRQVEMGVSPDGQRVALTYAFRFDDEDVGALYNYYVKVYDAQTNTVRHVGQTHPVDEARPHWLTNDDFLVVMNPHLDDPYTAFHGTIDGYWTELAQSQQAFNVLHNPARVMWSDDLTFYSYDLASRETQVAFEADQCGRGKDFRNWHEACGGAVLYQDATITIVQALPSYGHCMMLLYHTQTGDLLQTAYGCIHEEEVFDLATDRYLPLSWRLAGSTLGHILDRETYQLIDYPYTIDISDPNRDRSTSYPRDPAYELSMDGNYLYVYGLIYNHSTQAFARIYKEGLNLEYNIARPFNWLSDNTFTVDVVGYRWHLRLDVTPQEDNS